MFQAMAEKWPDIGVVHANLGALALRLGRTEEALQAFRTAAKLERHLPERHGELAGALHGEGWMLDAFTSFKRQLLLTPEAPDPLYNIAITSQLIRSRQMARDWLERGTQLTVSSVNCWSRLARMEARLGNREAADRARMRALVLSPSDRDALHDRSFATLALPELRRSFCVGFDGSDDEIKRANTLRYAMVEALLNAGERQRARVFFETHLIGLEVTDKYIRLARQLEIPGHQALQTEYEIWLSLYDVHDDAAIAGIIAGWGKPPAIDIVMPVCDPPPDILREAIASVTAQSYANWTLLIADDCSSAPEIHAILDGAEKHAQIKVIKRSERGHISEASNSALALGTAPWVTFLDHDDLLHRHALYYLAEKLQQSPDLEMIFTDEDQISPAGAHFNPILKPAWDEDAILAQNYLNHITLHRRALVEQVGGFRKGYEGSQDHDLILRVSRLTRKERIAHIPLILYHWRAIPGSAASDADAKPYAIKARLKAVQDHMAVIEPDAQVSLIEGACRVCRPLPSPRPSVSVIIPTKDGLELLRRCVDGLLHGTDWPALELIIVDNGSELDSTKTYLHILEEAGQATIVRAPGPFNYSALVNAGARTASGEILVFLNNDIEVLEADWLTELVSHATRPDVGVVGAKLLYPDFKVQHAGIFLSPDYVAFHGHAGISANAPGHLNRARIAQTVAAVTGACQTIRRDLFFQIGGYDAEHLAVDFSDIDLCLRATERGFRTIWTPFARLIHHESATRGAYLSQEKRARHAREFQVMKERWAHLLEDDPSYNPNLKAGPNKESFKLAFPPRRIR